MKIILKSEVFFRSIRHFFSRHRWIFKFSEIESRRHISDSKGLIIIQIDGLSKMQLESAISKGKMPFIKKLIKQENYVLHSLYSGLPSSTPAVQGELFYGIKTIVPAFSFKSHKLGKVLRMYDSEAANFIEEQLNKNGAKPLLNGGSSYCNIYSGGASEINFCPGSPGWSGLVAKLGLVRKCLFFILHAYSLLRVLALLVLEFFIATVDFFRGVIKKGEFLKELNFIPIRVAICILLRELITIGTKLDIIKGLPIIHLNFIGYDEQAHRRGPKSLFAHWALKGIDDCISRIWNAAVNSRSRDYDIWIYSDHGQEETVPYVQKMHSDITTTVNKVYQSFSRSSLQVHAPLSTHGITSSRATYLGSKYIQRLITKIQIKSVKKHDDIGSSSAMVVAMGPVGFVYLPEKLSDRSLEKFAKTLISEARIPSIVLTAKESLLLFNSEGKFELQQNIERLIGADHPFFKDLATDIVRLCRHSDAGDMVIFGWKPGAPCLSFPLEHGSHAGPGTAETHAFTLLPVDTGINMESTSTDDPSPSYLKISDLRDAALSELESKTPPLPLAVRNSLKPRSCLRLMTYNVHSCMGMDGRVSPQRIARVIAQYSPDIVALQELDVSKARSAYHDQAHLIAEALEMIFHFHPAIYIEEERYGDAILTHLPMRVMKADNLSEKAYLPHLEPRGAIWSTIKFRDTRLQVINTHLGLNRREKIAQVSTLLGPDWLEHPQCVSPRILCGDFNATPTSAAYKKLATKLRDVQVEIPNQKSRNTFYSRFPSLRIDHVFIDHQLLSRKIFVPRNALTQVASDHLPLVVDLELRV